MLRPATCKRRGPAKTPGLAPTARNLKLTQGWEKYARLWYVSDTYLHFSRLNIDGKIATCSYCKVVTGEQL